MPRYLDGLESIQTIHVTKFKDKPWQTTKLPWTSFQGDARSEPCLKDTPPPTSRSAAQAHGGTKSATICRRGDRRM